MSIIQKHKEMLKCVEHLMDIGYSYYLTEPFKPYEVDIIIMHNGGEICRRKHSTDNFIEACLLHQRIRKLSKVNV